MIEIDHISKNYGSIQALDDVHFHIEEGQCFGLVGPNGAGKSTLMKILAGILLRFDGDILVNGRAVSKDRLHIKQQIGYIPQEICLEETLTAYDNMLLFGQLYKLSGKKLHERMDAVLEQIGLKDRKKDKVSIFSGGMKRRLNIGCALMHEPAVVIMDEPTVGIDPQSRNSIFALVNQLKAAGSTIIYSSHYMEEVEQLCDTIGMIDQGKLIEWGTMNELLDRHGNPSIFAAADGLDADAMKPFGTIEPKGDGFLIDSQSPLEALEQMVSYFREKEMQPRRLELYQPRLEDIFFQLTGTQLRDD